MSMSEAPAVKINFSTTQDISDELLGGTIKFCSETGYKQNVMMITFLWAGFLLSIREELDEHKLVDDVLGCYIKSLSVLFPKLNVDMLFKKQVREMLDHYWKNLNKDFETLKSVPEISTYVQIANKLNSQDDVVSAYMLNKSPEQAFSKVSVTLNASIYRILRQLDGGVGIQYRGILSEIGYMNIRQQSNSASAEATRRAQPVVNRAPAYQPQNDDSVPWVKIFVWLAIFAILMGALIVGTADDSVSTQVSNQKPAEIMAQEPQLTALQEPRSGAIMLGREVTDESELTITASSGESCVVKLKTASGKTRLCFYVRAGDTVTVGMPNEELYVYFASGKTWYGDKHLFGSSTSYSMDDEMRDFTRYTWGYTLYPVNNGNFSETPIDPEDF